MCWWPQHPGTPPASQWVDDDEDDVTLVTASFPHTPAHDSVMEAVSTHYPPPTGRSSQVSTPQRSRPTSSGKMLELTPLWEQVLRYNRLPQSVEKVKVFAEFAMRLSDPEWEVRQHALRVMLDLIPVVPQSNNDLDALMIPVVLTEVTYNLGHAAPAVRKSALDVLSTYIKHSSDPEFVLRSIVSQGLESPVTNSNLSISVLLSIPRLLRDLQDSLHTRDQTISHQSLVQFVTVLSKRLVQNGFQEQAIDAMVTLKELVGENRFNHFLESYYPQIKRDFEVLTKIYEGRPDKDKYVESFDDGSKELDVNENEEDEEEWSDNGEAVHCSSNVTSSTSTTERSRFELSNEEVDKLESNSKLYTRVDTDSTAEKEDAVDDDDYVQTDSGGGDSSEIEEHGSDNHNRAAINSKKQTEIDRFFGEKTDRENNADIDPSRVVMETEIKFDSKTAITMTILEEKEDELKKTKTDDKNISYKEPENQDERFINDFVMHLVDNNENGIKKTPRRVRFGGEVVKLRTPDSDVTIEIHEEINGKETPILTFVDTKGETNIRNESPKVTRKFNVEATNLSKVSPKFLNKLNLEGDFRESLKIPRKTISEQTTKEPPRLVKKAKKKKSPKLSVSGTESVLYTREDKITKIRPRSSHIPLPIVPALSRPQLPWRKKLQTTTDEEESHIPTMDGGESLTSGSEGEHPPSKSGFRNIRVAHEADEWQRLGFIDHNQLLTLVADDDWRAKVRGLDKLTVSLRQPEVARFVSVSSKLAGLSLLLFLLKTLQDDRSQRVVCSSLRAVRALVVALPLADLLHELPSVVPSVCRHVGGGASVAVKLEAIEAVKSLMRTVRPRAVIEVLFSDRCFHSKSSRLRENALLCLMYGLMTFPSTEFPVGKLAQNIMVAAVREPKRRVRQSVLEALAALAPFLPPAQMRPDPEDFSPSDADDALFFTNALQTRLMRKVLPSVSPEGLILYGLYIPNNPDNFSSNQNSESANGNSTMSSTTEVTNNNQGADVEWVLAGSGVLSSGSARSRTQLYNAQRGFISPTDKQADSSPAWDNDPMTVAGVAMNSSKDTLSSEESKASQDASSDPRLTHPSQVVNMRPLYNMRVQNGFHETSYTNPFHQDQGFPKLNNNNSQVSQRNHSDSLSQTWSGPNKLSSRKLAILEPLDHTYQYGLFKVYDNEVVAPTHPHVSINPSNLPPLDWRPQNRWVPEPQVQFDQGVSRTQDNQRTSRWSRRQEDISRRTNNIGTRENGLRPVLARQSKYSVGQTNGHTTPQPERFVTPSPQPPSPHPPSPLAPLVPSSPLLQRQQLDATLPLVVSSPHSQPLQVEDLSGENTSEEQRSRPASQAHDQVDVPTLAVQDERLSTPPPLTLPPAVETETETTQSEELPGSERTPGTRKKFGKNVGKPRLRLGRSTSKEKNGVDNSSGPEVTPFNNPKEALSQCIVQMEHPDWEMNITGLQSLVRLAVHHSPVLSPVLHQIVVAVTKSVRNLRSQVARVACRAAMHLFTALGRGVEHVRDVEELCAVLLSRTADTNKFLRADGNSALDAMMDNVTASKAVSFVVTKGAKHQSAVVRATSCRLLLRLCARLGPERVLSLPRETRDAILNTGARSLTEGSLDTRRYAKEMLILLSQDQRLPNLLTEVVPSTVMRNIGKVLTRLTAK